MDFYRSSGIAYIQKLVCHMNITNTSAKSAFAIRNHEKKILLDSCICIVCSGNKIEHMPHQTHLELHSRNLYNLHKKVETAEQQ